MQLPGDIEIKTTVETRNSGNCDCKIESVMALVNSKGSEISLLHDEIKDTNITIEDYKRNNSSILELKNII